MTIRSARAIFLVGTLSSALLFLALTFDTHRQIDALTHADRLSAEVVAGKKVFERHNCNDCHTMLGFGGYYAPDLTRVYSRRGEDYIRSVLTRPEAVLAKSFRKMPQQHLSPQEIDRLVAFFRWTKDIDTHDWPPQDSRKHRSSEANTLVAAVGLSPGAALFKANNCFACHKLKGVGGEIGPALDGVGARLSVAMIKKQITNPKSVNPNSIMPAYNRLSSKDVEALAEFLAGQGGEQ